MTAAQNLCRYLTSPLRVGETTIQGRAFLAPMSGVSDLGMRRLALRFGAGMAATEMVACDSYLDGESETTLRAEGEGLSHHVVQLVGCDPEAMALAAKRAEDS